jgi:hypothetical protein
MSDVEGQPDLVIEGRRTAHQDTDATTSPSPLNLIDYSSAGRTTPSPCRADRQFSMRPRSATSRIPAGSV